VLGRGAAGNLAATGGGSLLLVAAQAVLARLMGVEQYGFYAYALTVAQVLAVPAVLGLDTAAVRFAAAYRVEASWGLLRGFLRFAERAALACGAALGVVAAVVAWAIAGRLPGDLLATLWVAFLALPAMALLAVRCGTLQGLRRVVLARLPDHLLRPLAVVGLAALAYAAAGRLAAPLAMAVFLLDSAGAAAAAGWLLGRELPPEVAGALPRAEGRHWLRVSAPLFLVAEMRFLLHHTDILLLGALAGTTQAGIYTAAARLSRLTSFGLPAVNSIAAPMIAELFARGDRRGLQRVVTLASWGSTLSSLAFAGLLVALGGLLLRSFGAEFARGLPVLVVLSLGQLVNAATGPVGNLLNMTGHQDANARILAWVTGANAALSYPAILAWGPLGAAAVTSALEAAKNLWTWWIVRRRLGVNSSVFAWREAS
jgi:O-antigen/teichoic acid export membrane protein